MSTYPLAILQSLILISAANGAPVFSRGFGSELCLSDRRDRVARWPSSPGVPRLGEASLSCYSCGLRRSPHELPWQLVGLAAASAMAGDCLSSFIKRRFGLEPSSMTLVPSGPRIAVSCGCLRRLLAAWSSRRCLDRACVLRRRAGDVAAPLRRWPTRSSLLRDAAQQPV